MGGLGEDAFFLSSLSSSSPSSSSPLHAVIPVESLYCSVPGRPVISSDRHRRRRRRGPRSPSAPLQARSESVNSKQRKIFTGARNFLLFGVECVGGSDISVDGESNDTPGERKPEPLRASGRTLGVLVSDQEQKERREHRSKRRRKRRWCGRTR